MKRKMLWQINIVLFQQKWLINVNFGLYKLPIIIVDSKNFGLTGLMGTLGNRRIPQSPNAKCAECEMRRMLKLSNAKRAEMHSAHFASSDCRYHRYRLSAGISIQIYFILLFPQAHK